MWYNSLNVYYLKIKRNKVLIHATTLLTLESILLSERIKVQKTDII